MAQNDFSLLLSAMIDKAKSTQDIQKDLSSIQNKLQNEYKIKFGVELDSKTAKAISNQYSKVQQDVLKSNKIVLDNRISAYLKDNTKLSEGFKVKLVELQKQINSVDKTGLNNLKNGFKEVSTAANALGQSGKSSFDKFKGDLANFTTFLGAGTLIMSGVNSIRQMISSVIELDASLVDLQMATGYTNEETQKLLTTYIEMGQQLGATGTEVAAAASDYLRQGKTVAETNELITDSIVLSKIGQLDAASATKYLTTAMKGYKVEVSDVIGIVDKLSAVDMASATSAGGLAEGMAEVSNNARLAGISMDKLLGILAVVGETSGQSMSSVGNAFSTIFSRMANIKLKRLVDPEAKEDLNNVETSLENVGIKLRENNTTFRNFGDVLDDVNGKWNQMSEVNQRAIAVSIAGKDHMESFLILMENYAKAQEYAAISTDSAGTAMEKFSNYQNSVEAKTKSLQASLQSLAKNTINSQAVKSFLDLSNGLVKVVDNVGLLNISLISLSAVLGTKTTLGMTAFQGVLENVILKMGVGTKAAQTLGMALSVALPVAGALIAFNVLTKGIDALIVTTEELNEKAKESKEAYESAKTELSSVNTELETQNALMEELSNKDNLTYAEKGQLEDLREITKELRIQADLAEKAIERTQRKASVDAANTVNSDKYNVGSLLSNISSYDNNSDINNINNLNGEYINILKSEDANLAQLISAYKEYTKLKNEATTDEDIVLENSYNDVIVDIKDSIWESVTAIQEQKSSMEDYYNVIKDIPYDKMSSDQQKVYNAYNDTAKAIDFVYQKLDPNKLKELNFNDIFNSTDFENAKKNLLALAKAGELSEDTIKSNETYKKLITETGLGVGEVVEQINALSSATDESTESAEDASSSFDLLSESLEKISKGGKLLDSVKDEIKEIKTISTDTIGDILELYPSLEKSVQDYLAGKKTEKELLSDLQNAYEVDNANYKNYIMDKQLIDGTFYSNILTNMDDTVTELASQYGIDLKNFTNLAQAKAAVNDELVRTLQEAWNNLNIENMTDADIQRSEQRILNQGNVKDLFSLQDSFDDIVSNYKNNIVGYTGKPSKTNDKDKKKQEALQKVRDAFAKEDDKNKYLLDMDVIDEAEYYKRLNNLNKKYFKDKADFITEDRKNQVAYHNWEVKVAEESAKVNDDKIKSKFDANEHEYAMGEKSEEDYYKKLAKLNDYYYKDNKDKQDEYQSNLEKIHAYEVKLAEESIQKRFDSVEHRYAMGELSEEEYYKKLEWLNNEYYKNDKDNQDKYLDNLEKLHDYEVKLSEELYQKKIDGIAKSQSAMIESYNTVISDVLNEASDMEDGSSEQMKKYAEAAKVVSNESSYLKNEISKLNEMYRNGSIKQEEYTQLLDNLNNSLKDVSSSVEDLEKNMKSAIDDSMNDILDDMAEAYERQTDAINDNYDAYEKLINAQKDSLRAEKEAADYAKSIAQKTKAISEIENRIAELNPAASSGDRTALNEIKKLQEELADAQTDLSDTQAEHELDLKEDALDQSLEDYKEMTDAQLDSAKIVYDDKVSKLKALFEQEKLLIADAGSYFSSDFAVRIAEINKQIANTINDFNSSSGSSVSNNNGNLSDYINGAQRDLNNASGNVDSVSGVSDANRVAVLSVLQNGTGTGTSSALNKYIADKYGSPLSYNQMVQVAGLLGVNGISKVSDVNGDSEAVKKNRTNLLNALKNAKFKTGGSIIAKSPSKLIRSLTGEDALAAVSDEEEIFTKRGANTLENLLNTVAPKLENMFKFDVPNYKNLITNKTSSPTIQVILPPSTTIDNGAINNYRQFIPELTNAIAEKLLDVSRQYK